MTEKKEFPEAKFGLRGSSEDPVKFERKIKEMRMKSGLEPVDEEYLKKLAEENKKYNLPEDMDFDCNELYNGNPSYFKTAGGMILKFIEQEDKIRRKGYVLIKNDKGDYIWHFSDKISYDYEYGSITGYVMIRGSFKDIYPSDDDLENMFSTNENNQEEKN